jgi:hypothetical protein
MIYVASIVLGAVVGAAVGFAMVGLLHLGAEALRERNARRL